MRAPIRPPSSSAPPDLERANLTTEHATKGVDMNAGQDKNAKSSRTGVLATLASFAAAIVVAGAACLPAAAQADFGLIPGKTTVIAQNGDGTIATQAGSHPYSYTLHFELKTDGTGKSEGGEMRDVLTDLPPGLFGNPLAVPRCSIKSFEGGQPKCDPSTQVGVLRAILPGTGEAFGPLYNLTPQPGSAALLGFKAAGLIALLSGSLNSEDGYSIHVKATDLPVEATQATATIWGVPADPEHDPERGSSGGLHSDAPQLPFFTLPGSCQSPPLLSVEVDSKLAPGVFSTSGPVPMSDKAGNPVTLSGCESVPFAPQLGAGTSAGSADSPSGLGVQLKLPNQGLFNPKEGAVTETEPETMEVTLPQGITANPAAVNGQGVCTSHQYEHTECPESAKIGTLAAQTPLLEEAVEGSVYLAAPHDNPFGSLLALYIIAAAPQRGVLVKQAGRIEADPQTGQLRTTIDGLPPLPYSGFEVRLREGPRAPLITPQTCGTYQTIATLYPFSDPGTATIKTTPFTISSGANGGACASSEAGLPEHPTLQAGSTVPIAGAYSPFLFKISRDDGEQRFGAVVAEPPLGLVAKLASVPACSEAGLAQAASRTAEGDGAKELADPSCPAASQIGTVAAGAGAGPTPYYTTGKIYLAGPYKGAPLSFEAIVPAIAGPFDLGVVAPASPPTSTKKRRRSPPAQTRCRASSTASRSTSARSRFRWTSPNSPSTRPTANRRRSPAR